MRKNFYEETIKLTEPESSAQKLFSTNNYYHHSARLTYTFKAGDDKRINKNGILKVYNLSEPLEIPATKLLGKWKDTYIGISICLTNGEWQIEKKDYKKVVNIARENTLLTTIKSQILRFTPTYILGKLFNRRIDNDNLLTNM